MCRYHPMEREIAPWTCFKTSRSSVSTISSPARPRRSCWETWVRTSWQSSRAVDMKSPAGKAVVERLIAGADVVMENFRPGAMARLGFDPDRLLSDYPRLVYAAASGFGSSGPYAQRPGQDLLLQILAVSDDELSVDFDHGDVSDFSHVEGHGSHCERTMELHGARGWRVALRT